MTDLRPGLYDRLIDQLLGERLDALTGARLVADIRDVEPAELPDRMGEVLGIWAKEALASVASDNRVDAGQRDRGRVAVAFLTKHMTHSDTHRLWRTYLPGVGHRHVRMQLVASRADGQPLEVQGLGLDPSRSAAGTVIHHGRDS